MHLTAKLIDQPWQVPLADVTAPPARDAIVLPTPPAAAAPTPTPAPPAPVVEPPAASSAEASTSAPVEGTPVVEGDKPATETSADAPVVEGEGAVAASGEPGAATPAVEEEAKVTSEAMEVEPKVAEPEVAKVDEPVAPEPEPVLPPDFKTGTGIPRFEMTITGELLPPPGGVCVVHPFVVVGVNRVLTLVGLRTGPRGRGEGGIHEVPQEARRGLYGSRCHDVRQDWTF